MDSERIRIIIQPSSFTQRSSSSKFGNERCYETFLGDITSETAYTVYSIHVRHTFKNYLYILELKPKFRQLNIRQNCFSFVTGTMKI